MPRSRSTTPRNGEGPFLRSDPDDSLLLAQTFFGIIGITVLLLAAVMTERRRAEETVEEIAGALQESLLPSRLPEVPGIELAARFRPAGAGYLVGGDFYDVFGAARRRLGDRRGRRVRQGPRAAALTGLARYTLRAGAAIDHRPSRVLTMLNDALCRENSSPQLCTVVYVRMTPTETASV